MSLDISKRHKIIPNIRTRNIQEMPTTNKSVAFSKPNERKIYGCKSVRLMLEHSYLARLRKKYVNTDTCKIKIFWGYQFSFI